MYSYDFQMVDLLIRVNSPFVISQFLELSPYQVGFDSGKTPDAVYTIGYLPEDWTVRGQELYRDRLSAVYLHGDDTHRYFYWNIHSTDSYLLLISPGMGGEQKLYVRKEELSVLLPDFRISAFFSLERLLLEHRAFQLHASVIDWQGSGILFSAPSGTGKSTQADLWKTYTGAKILNGDRAMIRRLDEGYRVYGSPYAGSSGIYTNLSAPVRAIVTLEQGSENKLLSLTPVEAFQRLYRELTVSVWDADFVEKASRELAELIGSVPVYHLVCTPDRRAVDVLCEKLK